MFRQLILCVVVLAKTAVAYEREFTILPISSPRGRELTGWLNADVLKAQVASGAVSSEAELDSLLNRAKEGNEVSEGGSVSRFTKTKRYQGASLIRVV